MNRLASKFGVLTSCAGAALLLAQPVLAADEPDLLYEVCVEPSNRDQIRQARNDRITL
jgi:hypothetical protein